MIPRRGTLGARLAATPDDDEVVDLTDRPAEPTLTDAVLELARSLDALTARLDHPASR